jgi:hypothetical protein
MDYDIAHAAGALEPRDHSYSADTWRSLTDEERQEFRDQYETAIQNSSLPEASKQAKQLQLGFNSNLTLSAAFKRYVAGVDQWYT